MSVEKLPTRTRDLLFWAWCWKSDEQLEYSMCGCYLIASWQASCRFTYQLLDYLYRLDMFFEGHFALIVEIAELDSYLTFVYLEH